VLQLWNLEIFLVSYFLFFSFHWIFFLSLLIKNLYPEKSKQEIAAVAAKIALDRSHTIIKTYLQAKSHSEQLHYRKSFFFFFFF